MPLYFFFSWCDVNLFLFFFRECKFFYLQAAVCAAAAFLTVSHTRSDKKATCLTTSFAYIDFFLPHAQAAFKWRLVNE